MNEPSTTSQQRLRSRAARAVSAVVLLCAALLAVPGGPANAQQAPEPPPPVVLDEPTSGAAAIAALDDDFAAVAVRNDLTSTELSRILRTDDTAWLNRQGRLYYVDPLPPSPAERTPSERGPFPYSQTFQLHSKPGSNRVIYLDFNGHTVSGTRWNDDGLSTNPQAGFTLDGDASTFTNAEQDVIQGVFQRVAEDYAPFDVDVTTQDPGNAAIERTSAADTNYGTRAVITSSDEAWNTLCDRECGGLAFVGVFDFTSEHSEHQPAFVFQGGVSDEKSIAEATSHEVGHNLGLNHDGVIGGPGYYTGHGAWAPIMGVGYERPISQWSKGEYLNANNTEDDFAVMEANGLVPRADDHADVIGSGTPLASSGGSLVGSGVIETRTDLDFFQFTQSCTGNLSIAATPAPRSPNLDIALFVWDAAGNRLLGLNPESAMVSVDVASGLDVTTSFGPLGPGTYSVSIVGGSTASSFATDGYSKYGSVGAYSLSVGTCGGTGGTSISGVVRDSNGNPVKGARVTSTPATTTAISAADGSYDLGTAAAGTYTVKAEHLCSANKNQSVTVDGAETADFALSLSKCQLVNQAWIDGTTVLGLSGDDAAQTVNLPFTYRHLGTNHTQAHISTNGFVSFVAQSTSFSNTALPTAAAPNGAIYAFWDDLIDDASSNIRTRTLGTAPNRRFVIEWNNIKIIDTTRRLSFEIILSENTNQKPVILYKGVAAGTAETGTGATVGIENANGSKATQLNLNAGLVYDGVAVAPTSPK